MNPSAGYKTYCCCACDIYNDLLNNVKNLLNSYEASSTTTSSSGREAYWSCIKLPHPIPDPKLRSFPYVSRHDINDECYFSNWVSRMIAEKSSKRRLFRHSLIIIRSGPIRSPLSPQSTIGDDSAYSTPPTTLPASVSEHSRDVDDQTKMAHDVSIQRSHNNPNNNQTNITDAATSLSAPTTYVPTKCYVQWHTDKESHKLDLYFNSALRKKQKQRIFIDQLLLYLL